MNPMPDLNYLKYFYYVAKLGGFTKAAEELNVQQPVVSRAIKLLEEESHCKLLERQKKTIILTDEGKQVFTYCETLFNSAKNISDFLDQRNNQQRQISIACSDSLSFGLIEKIILQLKKDHPGLIINHYSGSAPNYIDDIQSGKVDMGFFFNLPKIPNDLSKLKIANVDFYYVIKSNKKTDPDTLNSFIATNSHNYESPLDLPLFKKYISYNKKAQIHFASNSSITRKTSVLNGLGVSILPSFMVNYEIKKGILATIHQPEKLSLYVLERNSSFRSPLKILIMDTIRDIVTSDI
jgi:DNA-binding transcriptional LysR family regulator